jgi:hypothetical protein
MLVLLPFLLVDFYTYQIYHFSTLVVLLRQKISFPQTKFKEIVFSAGAQRTHVVPYYSLLLSS